MMISKFNSGLFRKCVTHFIKNNRQKQNNVYSLSTSVSIPIRFHFSVQPQTLEKISNSENLFTRISSTESIPEVLKLFKENEDIYRNEHISQSARAFARLFKANATKEELENLKDPSYALFTQKVANNLKSFNENELLDILFWIRKYRFSKLPLLNMETKTNECIERIIEYCNKNVYNLKQLATIHFDVSHIGRNCDEICTKLIQEINKDSSQINPFICMNLLQSISLKQGYNSGKELILIDQLCKYLPNIYDQFEIPQKTLIFKCIAYVEPQITPPKYKIPTILYMIKNDLLDKIDSLNEHNVLNILNGYQYLVYSLFPQDLLEEIKEMIVVTVKHHPKNMKTSFLLEYLELLTILNKKKKTDSARMNILINELTKRIKENDEQLMNYKTEKLIAYCDKYIKANSSLIVELATKYETKINNSYFSVALLELTSKKAPLESFDRLLEAFFFGKKTTQEKMEALSKFSKPIQMRFCLALTYHKDRHPDLFQALSTMVEEMVENDPLQALNVLRTSTIYNFAKKELTVKAVQKYVASRMNDTDGQIAKAVLCSIEFKEARRIWVTTLLRNKQLDPQFVNKFIESFFAQESYDNQEKLLFLVNVISHSKPMPAKILISLMKDNTKFLQDISKYDSVFRKLLSLMYESFKNSPEQIRLINIYQICLRLESFNMRLDHFYKFMAAVFDIQAKTKKNEITSYIGFIYQIKLVENNVLKVEHAKSAFENPSIVDVQQKGKLLSLIAKTDTQYYTDNKEKYDKYFGHLLSQLSSTSSTMVLNSVASILRMPSNYLRNEQKFIMKSFKEHIANANDQTYTNVFTAIPYRASELYTPIVKEMMTQFPSMTRRLSFPQVRRILQKIVDLNIVDHSLLTSFLQEIGANFYTMSCEDRVVSMQLFCKLRIRQDDFIEKCLRMYIDNLASYRSYYLIIIESLYRVGYYSDTLNEFIKKSIKFWRFSTAEYIITLSLISISKDRKSELLNDISFKLTNPQSYLDSVSPGYNAQYFVLNTLYYSENHQNHPEILKFLSKCYGEDQKIKYPAKFIIPHSSYVMIQRYLSAMGIDYITNATVGKYEVPLFIPATKQVIKVNSLTNLNFDRKTFDGKTIQENMILESIPDVEIITINIPEFTSYEKLDYLQKINHLIKLGIKSNNTGVYDFSKFQTTSVNEEQEEQINTQQNQDDIPLSLEDDLLIAPEIEEIHTTKN